MVTALGFPPLSGVLGQSAAAIHHGVSNKKLHKIRDEGFPILIIGAMLDKCFRFSHKLHRQ
ncbi:hypothetical protein PC123_g16636 [Phytophthora cactorum]|nr:hypothetical protein PC123_g16636 [Phytophthora cactorum]